MTTDEHQRGILDTSVVVALERITSAASLPREPLITAITLAELSVGPLVTRNDAEREARQVRLQQAESDFDAIPFDDKAARAFGHVSASLRRSGRKPAARAFDALIAATAIAHGMPVYTANPNDFAGVDDLVVVSVPLPDVGPSQ